MTEIIKTPKHCSSCGARLVPSSSIQGFDPFSGDPVADQRLTCPNRSIIRGGKHSTWWLEGGAWVQA